jgi:hypothetical protein
LDYFSIWIIFPYFSEGSGEQPPMGKSTIFNR